MPASWLQRWLQKVFRWQARFVTSSTVLDGIMRGWWVPKDLRKIVGKTELRSPLGGDYRHALKLLSGAVAQLQHQIALAEQKAGAGRPPRCSASRACRRCCRQVCIPRQAGRHSQACG